MKTTEPEFLSIPEYARKVGRSRQAVYQDVAAGRVPAVRFGPRCLRIPASFLERASERALALTVDNLRVSSEGR